MYRIYRPLGMVGLYRKIVRCCTVYTTCSKEPGSNPLSCICMQYWCCYLTVDSVTPALWNGACSKRWISEQMRQKMLMFHNCSITNHDCYEKTALFYTFRSKQTLCISLFSRTQSSGYSSAMAGHWWFPSHHVNYKCFMPAACLYSSLQLIISVETMHTHW
jgi:hypothetical protein